MRAARLHEEFQLTALLWTARNYCVIHGLSVFGGRCGSAEKQISLWRLKGGTMIVSNKWITLVGVGLLLMLSPLAAMADCNATPGTTITKQNWTQYKDCFSEGVQHFWQGDLFWK